MITTILGTLRSFLLPFAYHFRKEGWRVDAMACGVSQNAQCLEAFDHVWEIEWSRNPLDIQNLISAPQTIRKVVELEQYDIVHVHTPVAAFVTRNALRDVKRQQKLQVIYTAHGFHFHPLGNPLKNTIFLSLEKLAGLWTDYLVVINREDELAAKHYQILPLNKIRYMPGIGIDLEHYSANAFSEAEVQQVRQEMGLSNENPLFLAVMELIPRKRPQDILKALAELARSNVHCALAGGGLMSEKMKQLASDLGISNQVHFLGDRRDIPTLMRASLATLLTSQQEGLPRSVMESLSMETPVIGTEIRGTQDLLKDGCGLLVKVGDIKGISEAMAWYLEHPEEAKAMGRLGRERMKEYDLQHIIKLHQELYTEALSQ